MPTCFFSERLAADCYGYKQAAMFEAIKLCVKRYNVFWEVNTKIYEETLATTDTPSYLNRQLLH